jgi:hypothetical protein
MQSRWFVFLSKLKSLEAPGSHTEPLAHSLESLFSQGERYNSSRE